jgi:hypothetical protein
MAEQWEGEGEDLGGLGWEKTRGLETRGTKNAGTPSDHTTSLWIQSTGFKGFFFKKKNQIV